MRWIGPVGWSFLVFTCVLLPWVAIRSAGRVRAAGVTPTRRQHVASVVITQGVMLLLALLTAARERIDLFPQPSVTTPGCLAAVAVLALALGTLPWRWRRRSEEEKRRRLWMLPGKSADLAWWTLVALIAGTVEEIVFRGVLFQLLMWLTGAWWFSVLVAVIVFGMAHWIQGAETALIVAVISVGMHVVVRLSGDLYTAMLLHFVYDLLAGVLLMRMARRDGLLPQA